MAASLTYGFSGNGILGVSLINASLRADSLRVFSCLGSVPAEGERMSAIEKRTASREVVMDVR